MNKQQYTEYLRSPEWREKRKDKLIEAGYKCTKCGNGAAGVALEVHHLTYDRVGNERLSDLRVLCRSCHEDTHRTGFVPAQMDTKIEWQKWMNAEKPWQLSKAERESKYGKRLAK